jgi:hypothetical protein
VPFAMTPFWRAGYPLRLNTSCRHHPSFLASQ